MDIKILGHGSKEGFYEFHLFASENPEKKEPTYLYPASLNALVSVLLLTDTHPFLLVYLFEDENKRMLIEADEVGQLSRFAVSQSFVREDNYWRRINIQELSTTELQDEDEGLLLFSQLPPDELPQWPEFITEYDSIYINKTDEFFNISTVNNEIIEKIKKFPPLDRKAHFGR